MENDVIEKGLIDPHVDAYEGFFDHGWANRMFEAVEKSPLRDAVDTVMVAWRSTNGAHLLPWLMVQSLKGFAEGEYKGNLGFRASYSDRIISGLVEKLDSGMEYSLKLDQRLALKRVVAKIEEEAFQVHKTAQDEFQFPITEYWDFLVHTTEFRFCIVGTQRVNYGSLFFAYEDFLANVIRTKEANYTSKDVSIKKAFAKHFGDALADLCWNHDEIDLARLVRHALAHNGGRYGPDLEKHKTRFVDATGVSAPKLQPELFILLNGKIQIMPGNTRHLFGVLKLRVSRIVEQLVC